MLAALPEGMRTYVGAETHASALELQTDPHGTVRETVAQLRRLRSDLADGLASIGLAAGAAGTHATAVWSEIEITPAERYALIHRTMRELAGREPTYALHVHVGVRNPERAIDLYNRMRAHLPTLLALSGNSPYWQGRDAGFASTRTVLWHAFPRTGMPRRWLAYDEWVEAVDLQIRSGALPEATFLWWDVRPQPKLGTVEMRVMDAQTRIEDTAALVALVQSVARLELEEGYVSGTIVAAEEVLAENRFIAARDGMDAQLIDTTRERCGRSARSWRICCRRPRRTPPSSAARTRWRTCAASPPTRAPSASAATRPSATTSPGRSPRSPTVPQP